MEAYCFPSNIMECPEFLAPFPLYPALPDSLDGRDSVEYYWAAFPMRALVTYPPIPVGSAFGFRHSLAQHFIPSALGVLPYP
jgi:hypothetical protein